MRAHIRLVLALSLAVNVLFAALWFVPQSLIQAQSGSQYFPQTQHWVRGRFLQYWQDHGGLTQQGYPLTEEFQEKNALDGKTYTVQYFERAIFELHPENKPPYDVLLSQLGKFELDARYPNGSNPAAAPQPAPGGQPTATTAPAVTPTVNVTDAGAVLDALKAAGLPVGERVVYTADTDPNHLLGRPNGYIAKANFHDTRLPIDPSGTFDTEHGGSVEIFTSAAAAQARADYIINLGKGVPALIEYDFVHNAILLRLSKQLTPDQANAYKTVLNSFP